MIAIKNVYGMTHKIMYFLAVLWYNDIQIYTYFEGGF